VDYIYSGGTKVCTPPPVAPSPLGPNNQSFDAAFLTRLILSNIWYLLAPDEALSHIDFEELQNQ
jgi:hypothetical protein